MAQVSNQTVSGYHIDNIRSSHANGWVAAIRKGARSPLYGALLTVLCFWGVETLIWHWWLMPQLSLTELLVTAAPPMLMYSRLVVGLSAVVVVIVALPHAAANRLARALKRSAKWFSAALQSTGNAIIAVNRDGRVMFMNRAAEDLTGWQLVRAVGQPLPHVCSLRFERTGDTCDALLMSAARGSKQERLGPHILLEAADGRKLLVSGSLSPIVEPDGHAAGSILSLHDVTAIHEAEAARNQLAAVVDQATDAVLIADTNGVLTYANHHLLRLTGLSYDKVVGRPLAQIFAASPAAARDEVALAMRNEARWRGQLVMPGPAGATRQVETALFPLRGLRGELQNFVAISRDLTKELALRNQLNHAQKMETVGRLAGGVAHDFNNLLTVISGYSEMLLLNLPEDSPARGPVDEIRKAGECATALTRQLLTASRKEDFNPVVIDPNQALTDLGDMLRRLVPGAIQIKFDLAPMVSCVKVDSHQMSQAIMNLITNAADAIDGEGLITVSTSDVEIDQRRDGAAMPQGATYVQISIADNGCGMDEQVLDSIFEPFYTTKEAGKGTGLGLAIVYSFVVEAGGSVQVSSRLNEGTVFRLRLPATCRRSGPELS